MEYKLSFVVVLCCLQGVESDAENCKLLAHFCNEAAQRYQCQVKKALDIMCSVGRFAHELSKHLDKVT